MTLETLEICFQANLGGVEGQLEALAGRLGALDGAALAAKSALDGIGRQWIEEIGRGLSAALPDLKRRLTGMGRELSAWLETATQDCGAEEKGSALSGLFAQGLRSGSMSALAAAKAVAGAARFEGGTAAAGDAGRRLSGLFAQGVVSGSMPALAAAKAVADSARFEGGTAAARSAGRALSEGFAAGIRDRAGSVNAAVRAMVSAATGRIRSLLSIHSPSKVTEGFGAYFGEGFALGVRGSVDGVERAAEALGGAANAKLQTAALPDVATAAGTGLDSMVQRAVERALGSVQITVPLNVDGMKLGEASIRGINAVTRSAGKVLLNL